MACDGPRLSHPQRVLVALDVISIARANFREHTPAFGDAVRLRIGGPAMLVVDVLNSGKFVCSWLAGGETVEATYWPLNLRVIKKARTA